MTISSSVLSTIHKHIFILFTFVAMHICAGSAFAQTTESPQTVTVDGRLFEAGSTTDALIDSSVVMKVQILNPAKSCILYEEQHTFSTLATNGYFNIQVGSNVGDLAKRSALDSANSMATVFFNRSTPITGKTSGGGGCAYTPASTDVRHFRFFVTPSTVGTTSQLSPDMRVDSVPQALVAQTLQGLGKDDVFKTSVTSTQAKLDNLLTTNYTNITDLIGGTSSMYLRNASTGTLLPTRATDPSTPAAGQLWYDTTSNEIKYYNGTTVQAVGAAGAGISSLTAGAGLDGGTITTSGTISIATGGVTNAMLASGIDASKITAGTLPAGVVPTNTDTTKLPLAGGTMTGAITMGADTTFAGYNLLGVGHITMNSQKTITIGRYDAGQETTLISTLTGANAGATWYNSFTNKLMYWDGGAARELAETSTAGGDITAVNTNAGSGLTGGNTSGPITLAINVDNNTIEIATNTVQVKDAGITTAKLANDAVTSAKILDGEIVNADISATAAISWSKIDKAGATAADIGAVPTSRTISTNAGSGLTGGGDLTANRALAVNVDNSTIEVATNTVQVKDGGITNAKIASMNITKLTAGAGDYFSYMPAGTECANGEVLKWDTTTDRWLCGADSAGVTDHGALTGLADDDHTQYVMLAGRAGGQNLRGGTASGEDLTIESTSNVTKGDVIIQPNGGYVGIGTTAPSSLLSINGGTGSLSTGLTFGDGDTGIFETSDDRLYIQVNGLNGVDIGQNYMASTTSRGYHLYKLAGAASNPTFAFVSDTNTGMYSATADILSFATNGSERVTIDSTGNVGIGTTNPSTLLEVASNSPIIKLTDTAGPISALISGSSGNLHFTTATTARDVVINGGSGNAILTVKGTGNVGIGTTVPAAKLDIEGTIQIGDGGETCSIAANAGMIKYATGALQYCNGSAWQTLGVSGSGLTTLNGQTGSTQTFAVNASGTAPAINSATNTHTISIPLASGAGVTSGTISKTDYDSFVAKLSAVSGSTLNSGRIWVGDSGNQAAAVLMSGDATLSNTGALTIAADAITTGKIADGTITNADISGTAAIAWSKIDKTGAVAADVGAAPSTRSIATAAGSGLSGGGDLSADRSLSLNINGTTAETVPASGDEIIMYDTSATALRKITRANFLTGYLQSSIGTSAGTVMGADAVPNCTAAQKLQMSLGPTYTWSCVSEAVSNVVADADNDTKIQVEEAADEDKIRFDTAGTERMIIDNAGNVGIGTTTPAFPLDLIGNMSISGTAIVAGSSGSNFALRRNVDDNVLILSGGNGAATGANFRLHGSTHATAPNVLTINNSGSEAMRVSASGNVGIGTTVPVSLLHIETADSAVSTSGSNSMLRIANTSTADNRSTLRLQKADSVSGTRYGDLRLNNNGVMEFAVGTSSGTLTPAEMVIVATGNVGIGTTVPATKLDIEGTIQIGDGGETCSIAANAGMIKYATGTLQYCNGSAWQTLGVSGSGLTTFNGQTGSTQTFAVDATGTAPAINSATNTHTLSIPLASGAGVTSGTISKTDYDSFVAKLSAVSGSTLNSARIWVGDSGNQAAAVLMSGDATLNNAGVLTIGSNAIGSAEITDGSVANADIASVNITKLTNGAGDYFAYMPAGTECNTGEVLKWNATTDRWLCDTDATGSSDHGTLAGLGDDDHTQYVMLAGRAGGQNLRGGTASGEDLILESTSHATKGDVVLQPTSGNVGIGSSAPSNRLDVAGAIGSTKIIVGDGTNSLPSMTFTSETNSGFYRSSSGNIGVSIAGVARYLMNDDHIRSTSGNGFRLFNGSFASSATTPVYTIGGDTNTGIFFPAADELAVTSGGTERLRFNSTGNVGIGTTNPSDKLHVSGHIRAENWIHTVATVNTPYSSSGASVYPMFGAATASQMFIQNTSTTNGTMALQRFLVQNSSSNSQNAYISAVSNSGAGEYSPSIVIGQQTGASSYSERLRIDSVGNVGIGTTAPTAALHLKAGTATANTAPLKLTSGTVLGTPEAGAIEYDGTSLYYTDSGNTRRALASSGASISAGAGSVGAPSLSFSADPNTGFYSNGADVIGVSAGGANVFNLSSAGLVSPTTGGGVVTTAYGTAAAPTFSFAGDTDTGWWRPAADTMAASTAGTERLRINSSGSVGIGTGNPAANLHIFGTSGRAFRVETPNDFVGEFISTDPTALLVFEDSTSTDDGNYIGVTGDTLRLGTAGADRLRIDSSGKVGIGTILLPKFCT